MATTVIDAALQEFASTVDVSKAPGSMRCPKCPRLLINAYKGGCCDTSICEICFTEANNTCPQCSHTPYNIDTVKASSNSRKTVKSWLKEQKAKAEQQNSTVESLNEGVSQAAVDEAQDSVVNGQDAESDTIEEHQAEPAMDTEGAIQSIENQDLAGEPHSDQVEAGDDDVEFQVELDHDDPAYVPPHIPEDDEQNYDDQDFPVQSREENIEKRQSAMQDIQESQFDLGSISNGPNSLNMDFSNPMMNMQQMQQMMVANGFPSMMNMPMGMNSMGNMFGGVNGGMNGMNMMNFNPQNMFGAFQNNMWQNNNANAFPNGMGGDFNYGFQSNFNQQQQLLNGDFQQYGYRGRGYGRGRGRGRGGYGRGRGNFYNNYDSHHNNFQTRDQRFQGQLPFTDGQPPSRQEIPKPAPFQIEDHHIDDDEFAPGGQEEVQEALGEDYAKTVIEEPAPVPEQVPTTNERDDTEMVTEAQNYETPEEQASTAAPSEDPKPVAEAYTEDLDLVMPPPSAPLGPSRSHDKDFGFRSRGQSRFSRTRGSLRLPNGHAASPVRSTSGMSIPQSESPGVVGAPTGPRAMREPSQPVRKPSTGFQILGRASLASRTSERRSLTPASHDDDYRSRRDSRRNEEDDHDRRSSHRGSTYNHNGDHDMHDDDESYSRSTSHDRSRRSRRDRDKHENRSSKHDRRGDRDRVDNGYGEDVDEADRSHRRDRKHHDRELDREREREKEKDRDRDRAERDREREDRHREKDKDRKRRRDRDAEEDQDDEYDSPRHKSRRHRKEHNTASVRNEDTNGTGRSSHRASQVPEPSPSKTDDVDPITRERMERDRQRMVKEQQRRDNAAAALKGSNSRSSAAPRRQINFKYEDEAERGIIEGERERNRARWR